MSQRPITATDNEWRGQCQDCHLHWGGWGDSNEKGNITDKAGEESTQRSKETDENVEESRSRMRVTQKQNCLRQNNRSHRLQVQEGKPDRERPSQILRGKEVTEVSACQKRIREYERGRGEEMDDEVGRCERRRMEMKQRQPMDRQAGTQYRAQLRVTQTAKTSHEWNLHPMGIRRQEVFDGHRRRSCETTINRAGVEETGTRYYTSKLTSNQRTLHMSGNQMLSLMRVVALIQNRGGGTLLIK